MHTLTLQKVALDDTGTFRVLASNRVGKKEMEAAFFVVTEKPGFGVPLKDVTTKIGATETFEVVVTGVPKPEVAWFKGDKELKKGKRIFFEEEEVAHSGMKYKMTIKDIDMKDFGEVCFRGQRLNFPKVTISILF